MLLLPGRQGASRGVRIVQQRDTLARVVAETRPHCECREAVHAGYWPARFAACPADFHFMACESQSPLGVYNPPPPPCPSLPLLYHIMLLLSLDLSFTMIHVGILCCTSTSQFTTGSPPPMRTPRPPTCHCPLVSRGDASKRQCPP